MKTGPKSVFWTHSGPGFGPRCVLQGMLPRPPFSTCEAKALFFVVRTNENRNTCAFPPLVPLLAAEFTITNCPAVLWATLPSWKDAHCGPLWASMHEHNYMALGGSSPPGPATTL